MVRLFVGDVGMGKTYCAIAYCLNKYKRIYTSRNLPIRSDNHEVIYYDAIDEVADFNCGVILIDECDYYFNSRNFQSLSEVFRRKLKEHRKDHVDFVMTTQSLDFIDKVARTFLSDCVLMTRIPLPLVGAVVKRHCVKPIYCRHCNEKMPDSKWADFYSTYLFLGRHVRPSDLKGEETLELPEGVIPRGLSFSVYDNMVSGTYNTHQKIV